MRGRDIKRYGYEFADKWLINTHNGIREKDIPAVDVKRYPAIKAHLDQFYQQLAKRQDKGDTPYNLRNCAYMEDFNRQKIIWGEISDNSKFCLINNVCYPEATTFFMIGKHLTYLLAVFNSRLGEWLFRQIGTTTGVGTNRWKKYKLEEFYVKRPTNDELSTISCNVKQLLKVGLSNERIKTIDYYIYKIYGLNNREINFINALDYIN